MTDAISFEITRIQAILNYTGLRLRLPNDVERLFKQQTEKHRRRGLAFAAFVGLISFDLLIFSDYMLLRDVFGLCLIFRFGVITPLAIAAMIYVSKTRSPILRECSQGALCILASFGLVLLEIYSNEPGRLYHHFELIEILLYATIVQRLRFTFSAALAAALYAMHISLVLQFSELPLGSRFALNFEIIASFVVILSANYAGERWKRRQFLLTHLDHLRTDQMENFANFDALTNLPNRRSLDKYIDARNSIHSAVILIDVDHFKKYNDYYGHLGGDRCLVAIGETLRLFKDCGSIIARYGGEEFIIIIDGPKSMLAPSVAQTIRQRVCDLALPHEGCSRGAHVTVSIGVAVGRAETDHEMLRLIRRADKALYSAKADGRNKVSVYGSRVGLDDLSVAC